MLLEAVLALSIFIVAVVGMIKSLNVGLDADYEQQRLTTMRLNLQSLLDESLADPPIKTVMETAPDGFHVRYRREIEPVDVLLSNNIKLSNLFKITVTAIDTQRDDRVIGTLWTYATP